MTFSPALRRFTFTTHVTSSVGWVGAAFVFVSLAVIGLTAEDEATVRGAYLVMAPAAWFVLVPLAHASLVSGIALSLGTAWGLFRQYWVVFKLLITAFATAILLIYMGTFREMAGIAADPVLDLEHVRNASPLVHAVLALVLLLGATWLGVYKPFGPTPYGARTLKEHASGMPGVLSAGFSRDSAATNPATKRLTPVRRDLYLLVGLAGLLLLLLILHVIGGGVGGH